MSTRRALVFSFVDRYASLMVTIASSMVIARLLRPDEIGVFSVAMALLAFVATVRDMGAGQYLIQAKEIDQALLKAVWTILFSIGLCLALLVAILAWPVSIFYDEPRLLAITLVMAATYLLTPIGSITYALLMREMRFEHVALMRFSSSLAGAVVSISLAFLDMGPISLAWGVLASSVVTAISSLFFRRHKQPWGLSFRGARNVLVFGGQLTATSMLNTMITSTPDFAIGKLQGMHEAGLYSRSNGLVSMINRLFADAVWSVASSHFAKQRRDQQDPAADFVQGVSFMTLFGFTFAIFLALLADPITRVLYGSQWGESVPLTQFLALGGAAGAANYLCIALLTGSGRADLLFRATLVSGIAIVAAAVVGAALGLQALGQFMMAASTFAAVVWFYYAHRVCRFRVAELMKSLGRSALVATLGCSVLIPLNQFAALTNASPILHVGLSLVVCTIATILAIFATGHSFSAEITRFLRRIHPLRD
jgi:O-antigen/teichoic acid export membrane protein